MKMRYKRRVERRYDGNRLGVEFWIIFGLFRYYCTGPVPRKDMQTPLPSLSPPPQKWPYLHDKCPHCWIEWKIIFGHLKWPNLHRRCGLIWQWFFCSWFFFCATFSFWDMIDFVYRQKFSFDAVWVRRHAVWHGRPTFRPIHFRPTFFRPILT